MSDIDTLYFSMFRQKASGSNCCMITTGQPTKSIKGRSITAPAISALSVFLQKGKPQKPYHKCDKTVGTQASRPFLSVSEDRRVGS